MKLFVFAAIVLALASASAATQQRVPWPVAVTSIPSPAGANSSGPQLTVSKKGTLLSWIEQADGRATLKFAERMAGGWSPARTVASGSDWFVNWADVPSVVRLDDGSLAAHWLQKSGADSYAYDVRLSYSRDDGKTWAPSFTPHTDGTKTEHGFASLFQMPGNGGLGLVWLDGRNMQPGHGEHGGGDMSLRFAAYDRTWKQVQESAIDLKVCECCPTSVAVSAEGPIAVYRNRADGEIRDIHASRLSAGKWSEPVPVSKEDWQFPACPVNGPSVSARGQNLAVAWFQAKDGLPKAFVAFSADAGRTFGKPVRLDSEGTLGRVDVEMLPDGSAAAAYIDLTGNRAEFRARLVTPAGVASTPITIASLANNRSSGYPRMAASGGELVFAWVDRDNGSSVRTAAARLTPR
jgi:hypothetical protein